jgi:transposase-like protein
MLRLAHAPRVRQAAFTTVPVAKLKALERKNKELRQANEILRKAGAYFARLSSTAG